MHRTHEKIHLAITQHPSYLMSQSIVTLYTDWDKKKDYERGNLVAVMLQFWVGNENQPAQGTIFSA